MSPRGTTETFAGHCTYVFFAANIDEQATPGVALIARIVDARSDVGFGHIETITERR